MDTVEICNVALARIGEARILSLNDANSAARACKLLYQPTLDEMLRSHPWNFAMTRAELVMDAEAPTFGGQVSYSLPADCLRVIEVNGITGTGYPSINWEIEGKHIITSDSVARVKYIKQVTDSNILDSLASAALVVLLASKLATTLQGGATTKADALLAEYVRLVKPIAQTTDSNESRKSGTNLMDQALEGSRALAARYGYGEFRAPGV